MAKLNSKYFWEKLLIPPFIFFFQKLFPFRKSKRLKRKVSAAAGGFILCKSQIFKRKTGMKVLKIKSLMIVILLNF